jgi:hypothetical protein
MTADVRPEALRLAVDLYAGSPLLRDHPAEGVVNAAREFAAVLAAHPAVLTVGDPVIASQSDPGHHIPVTRTGADMAVTMTDTDQAVYPAPSEADSKGFPVTGDTITVAESSGGSVVAMTQNPDGTTTFAAVAPGAAQVSWTDGTLSFADTINVTAGAAATIVVGTPTVEPQPAAPTPSA